MQFARSGWCLWRGAAWVAVLCGALGASAQTQAPAAPLTESQAKASALLNFARYVEWPERVFASRESPFVFCLAGRDSLSGAVAGLEGRTLQGRVTQVRRVLGVEDLRSCHLLFIGEAEERRLTPMLRAIANEPVLSVGDLAGFADAGGAIGIVLEEGRIRFDINRLALDQAQLRASSNLLRLARSTR
jgi:hypothetical protein